MLHPAVIRLADRLGVILSDRNACLSWQYDGESIALWHQYQVLDDYDEEHVRDFGPYPAHVLTSHDVLHELAHYIIASDVQREFPEFGLDWGIVVPTALGPLGSAYRTEDGRPTWTWEQAEAMCLLDESEANLQEFFAQQFSVSFGKKYGIPSQMHGSPEEVFNTWEDYLAYKRAEVEGDRERLELWTKAGELVSSEMKFF